MRKAGELKEFRVRSSQNGTRLHSRDCLEACHFLACPKRLGPVQRVGATLYTWLCCIVSLLAIKHNGQVLALPLSPWKEIFLASLLAAFDAVISCVHRYISQVEEQLNSNRLPFVCSAWEELKIYTTRQKHLHFTWLDPARNLTSHSQYE